MKRRLNFITLLIGIAIVIIVMKSGEAALLKASIKSIRIERNNENKADKINNRFMLLFFEPVTDYMPSTLLNKKNGNMVPASISLAIVKAPIEKRPGLNLLWDFICSVIYFSSIIMVIFNFIKIIIAVNKSIIFEWINVRRLRRIGVGFLILFISGAFIMANQNSAASEVLEIENYKIVNYSYDGAVLLLGIISFLIAEIFAVGLRLKEEQDLTI